MRPIRNIDRVRRHKIRVAAALCGVALVGCGGTDAPPPVAPQGEVILGPSGLLVAGTGLEIGFGRTEASSVAAVTKLLGQAPDEARMIDGCGRELTWPSGLTLTFVEGDFRGWRAPEGAHQTATGAVSAGRRCTTAVPGVG